MDSGTVNLIEAQGLTKKYEIEKTTIGVLRGVSLSIGAGESVSIIGASGAGKSTLLHILGALDRPTSGRVLYKGEDLYAAPAGRRTEIRALQIGFVFQAYHLLPELDVVDNVMLPAMSRRGSLGRAGELRQRAVDLLGLVGLGHRVGHRPYELSGGEQQRVALARALMNEPEVVLADEPTGNLDSKTGHIVLDYLFDLTRTRGHTLILVTHNEAVAKLSMRTLELKDGRLDG
ncbi:MAG: ABC transporter ATP-binding protein [bacterium]